MNYGSEAMKCNVVIPTCRNLSFLEKWEDTDLKNQHLIVVEDKSEPTCKLPEGWDITRYTHKDIDKELKKDAWIIARGDGGIKSFGLMKSYQDKDCKVTICLDDDVFPWDLDLKTNKHFVDGHCTALFKGTNNSRYINVFNVNTLFTRGYPFSERKKQKISLNMGLWENIPDYDAITQFNAPQTRELYKDFIDNYTLPKKCYASICAMNVALRNESIPAYYQLLMGPKWNMYRFDDIWSGIMYKRIADHLDYAVTFGDPKVWHSRASNMFTNLWKESHGLERNETFWNDVDAVEFNNSMNTWEECYDVLGNYIQGLGRVQGDAYLMKLGEAMCKWLEVLLK